jgi:DNA-binding protein YbaB
VGHDGPETNPEEATVTAEFEQLVAEFEKFQSKIKNVDDQFAGIGEMQAELTRLEASVTSPDGAITVTSGPGGSVTDVQFTKAALEQGPQALSAALMTTMRQAIAESARRQATIVDEHLGGDLNLVDQVLEAQADAFGISVDELKSRMPETAAPAPQADDFSERTILSEATEPPPRPTPPPPPSSQGDSFLKNLFDEEDPR